MHCGDFKSALEPFTRTEPSDEAREQVNRLLDGIYDGFVSLIADGRGLAPSDVKAAIDNAPLDAKAALKRNFVDTVATLPEFKKMVRKHYGKDVEIVTNYGSSRPEFDLQTSNPFALFQTLQKLFSPVIKGEEAPGIAIIYVEGAIVTGRTEQSLFGGSGSVGSSTVRAALENARNDDSIKAVVLRVNSPGGSALASDIMWDAATRCAAEKPLIVSMGNVAGSGGYYVAIPGDVIFAERTTITGSIGVVGGKMVIRGVTDWAGLTFTEIKRGEHADIYSTNRVWTDAERKFIKDYMVSIYEQFKGRVMQSRGKRIKGDLEKLAGGRVYTGTQALEIGLIDKIGGLDDALKYAAKEADLGIDYEVRIFPKPKGFAEILAQLFGEDTDDEWEVASPKLSLLGDRPFMQHFVPILERLAPAQAARLMKGLHNALIINDEHVGMFMPFDLDLR
ncbi:MAG: signal peptide peptidase SppA, partial [Planctomycetes bacterium]|nr:signal peptide peptidase SppA [Planctomycetota bacterium]